MAIKARSLVGYFFIMTQEGKLHRCGEILEQPNEGYYLVRFDNAPTENLVQLIMLDEIVRDIWDFYESEATWKKMVKLMRAPKPAPTPA